MLNFLYKLLISILLFSPSLAYSQQIGTAVRIVNNVQSDHNNTIRQLQRGDLVYAAEEIVTGADSSGAFRLTGNTRIVVGPSTRISLNELLVAGNADTSGVIKVTEGAFRFISGRFKKSTLTVSTPVATIGIRGTIFDVYVTKEGITDVVLFSGKVEVCTSQNNCRTVTDNCDIIQVRSQNDIKFTDFLRSGDRKREDAHYDLITRQGRFPFGWRAPTAGCDFRAGIESGLIDVGDEPDPPEPDPAPSEPTPEPAAAPAAPAPAEPAAPEPAEPAPDTPTAPTGVTGPSISITTPGTTP